MQIKPNLDVSLTLDDGKSESMLEIRINSVVKRKYVHSRGTVQLYSENRVILASAV